MKKEERIYIKDGENIYNPMVKEVYLIESCGNYSSVYFSSNVGKVLFSLNYWCSVLPESFVRISRTDIVNMRYLTGIRSLSSGGVLTLNYYIDVKVSRRRFVEIRSLIESSSINRGDLGKYGNDKKNTGLFSKLFMSISEFKI